VYKLLAKATTCLDVR